MIKNKRKVMIVLIFIASLIFVCVVTLLQQSPLDVLSIVLFMLFWPLYTFYTLRTFFVTRSGFTVLILLSIFVVFTFSQHLSYIEEVRTGNQPVTEQNLVAVMLLLFLLFFSFSLLVALYSSTFVLLWKDSEFALFISLSSSYLVPTIFFSLSGVFGFSDIFSSDEGLRAAIQSINSQPFDQVFLLSAPLFWGLPMIFIAPLAFVRHFLILVHDKMFSANNWLVAKH